MRVFSPLSVLLFAAACGQSPRPTPSAAQATGAHYGAANCEIFVDQIETSNSSHGTHSANFYVKTLNDRLDGAVAAVGMRVQTTQQTHGQPVSTGKWTDQTFAPYFGAADYFEGSFYFGSEFSTVTGVGVFFVRTVKGTTYWLRPRTGANYSFTDRLFYDIRALKDDPKYSYDAKIPTQAESVLRDYNPGVCY